MIRDKVVGFVLLVAAASCRGITNTAEAQKTCKRLAAERERSLPKPQGELNFWLKKLERNPNDFMAAQVLGYFRHPKATEVLRGTIENAEDIHSVLFAMISLAQVESGVSHPDLAERAATLLAFGESSDVRWEAAGALITLCDPTPLSSHYAALSQLHTRLEASYVIAHFGDLDPLEQTILDESVPASARLNALMRFREFSTNAEIEPILKKLVTDTSEEYLNPCGEELPCWQRLNEYANSTLKELRSPYPSKS